MHTEACLKGDSMMILIFAAGLMIGGCIGLTVAALCVAASEADRHISI